MKIRIQRRYCGSTLIVVLILTAIMGFSLASYLALVRYQNMSVMRSLSWNSCIPIVEAGIEEAMTHINRSGITNLLSAGWELSDGTYTKSRHLGDSYYVVRISQSDPPVIVTEGYVPVPYTPAAPVAWLAALGVDAQPATRYTQRRVRVTTRRDAMWTHGMVAKGNIDLMGQNVASDSFDSTDPRYSTGGQYDITKRRAKGDIATNSTITNSLNVPNGDIWGKASTGPGGSVAIGPNGSIGDLDWHAAFKRGVQPGYTNNDMNVYFGDVNRPYNGGFTPKSGSILTTNFTYLLTGGNYAMENLSLQGNDVMFITGHNKLRVTGSINLQGNGQIQIAAGASLELYMEGASASIGGNGIVNDTGYAINCLYFGLPTHTRLSFSGNGGFIGAIYAPDADFDLNGGGANSLDFIGASVSNTVKINGHFKFHYDEALGKLGLARGYVVNSWNEI